MILTVTLNPAVDISYKLDDFKIDNTNRCENTIKTAGGKGLNVARVLKQLGADVITTGFLGGHLGDFIKEELDKVNIKNDFLFTNKPTRNCIAILSNNKQTEIMESGAEQSKEDLDKFLEKYEALCKKVDVVCISGSASKGVESSYIEELIKIAKNQNKVVIVDSSGKVLEDIVTKFQVKPDFIKPNEDEFKDLINKIYSRKIDAIDITKEILENTKNIENVIVSRGGDGAYVKHCEKLYKVDIPKINVLNPVGSGDSSVAGLAFGLDNKLGFEDIIKLSNACGMSNAMTEKTGFVDVQMVKKLQKEIGVKQL